MTRKNTIEEAVLSVSGLYKDEAFNLFDRDDDGRPFEDRVASVREAIEEDAEHDYYDALQEAVHEALKKEEGGVLTPEDAEAARNALWSHIGGYIFGVLEDSHELYFADPFSVRSDPLVMSGIDQVATLKGSPEGRPDGEGHANARFFVRCVNMELIRRYEVIEFDEGITPAPWSIEKSAEGNFALALVAGEGVDRIVLGFAPETAREMLTHVVKRANELAPEASSTMTP